MEVIEIIEEVLKLLVGLLELGAAGFGIYYAIKSFISLFKEKSNVEK